MTQKDLLEGKRILIVDDEPVTEDHYSAKFLLKPPERQWSHSMNKEN